MSGASRNRLNNAQRYRLTRWLEENLPQMPDLSSNQVALRATEALQFPVSKDNVLSIAGSGDDRVIKHNWPVLACTVASENGHPDRRLALVARVVEEIRQRVQVTLPEDLGALWDELLGQINVPVGEVVAQNANHTLVDPNQPGEGPEQETA